MDKILFYVLLLQRCSAIITASAQTIDPETDPCRPFKPRIQNFTAPGRRINQIKCFEFILDFKNRENESNQKKECELKRQSGGFGFASPSVDYNQGEYPHMGALGWLANEGDTQNKWLFKCGGSLISSKFVITAAHCHRTTPSNETDAKAKPKIVRFGDRNLYRKKRVRRVLAIHPDPVDAQIFRFILHPEYKSPKRYYDIALIKLENDVKFTMLIQPACLWNSDDVRSVQTKATVSGWGVTDLNSGTTSSELQVSQLDLIDSNVCDNLLKYIQNRNWQGLKTNQICAGVLKGGIDTCQVALSHTPKNYFVDYMVANKDLTLGILTGPMGMVQQNVKWAKLAEELANYGPNKTVDQWLIGDSGGPLQTRIDLPLKRSAMHYLIGITSFGRGCGLANTPAVYTRISSFIDWIEDTVWPTKQ